MDPYLRNIIDQIKESENTIYDINNDLLIDELDLERILTHKLVGQSFGGLALRTRSKVIKSLVCDALGYPIPKSFKKCQPRFLAQNFDVYIQKSNNLQIWNEIITMDRRYVIIKLDDNDMVIRIKVLTGEDLAKYDTTGTITIKHQAILRVRQNPSAEIFSISDTKDFNLSSEQTRKISAELYDEIINDIMTLDLKEKYLKFLSKNLAINLRDKMWEIHFKTRFTLLMILVERKIINYNEVDFIKTIFMNENFYNAVIDERILDIGQVIDFLYGNFEEYKEYLEKLLLKINIVSEDIIPKQEKRDFLNRSVK